MNVSRKKARWQWAGRAAAAFAIGLGLVVAPATSTSAATLEAFAYQVFDCSTTGTDFGVAAGTPAAPGGPVRNATLKANAVQADGTVIAPLQLRTRKDAPDPDIRWATVEPGVKFDHVEFSVTVDGQSTTLKAPAAKPEVCDGPPVEQPKLNPSPGLTPVTPVRVYDSRTKTPAIEAGKTVRIKIGGANGVPTNAGAAMLNVTAAYPSAPGFLTVYPCDIGRPRTSNVNYIAGETRAGAVFSRVAANGDVCVYTSARTGVVVDLNGYVARLGDPSALDPKRVVDTRPGAVTDVAGTPKGKRTELLIPFRSLGFIEGGDVIMNITTVGADAPGHITVGGCGGDEDRFGVRASVVNYVPGRAQANLAFIHVNESTICLVASAPTHIIVDLVGFMDPPSGLLPGPPTYGRLLDTRAGQKTSDGEFQGVGRVKANVPLKLKVRDRLDADGATAAALNVTAVKESDNGHITVYPCGDTAPVASNLNYTAGTAIANVALSKLDADGNVCIVSYVDTDLVVDLAAFTSTTIFGETGDFLAPADGWGWSPVSSVLLRGQKGDEVTRSLWGGSGTYAVTGPAVSGLTVKIGIFGTLTTTVADDTYVMASPIYMLSDSDGNSQEVKMAILVDPQLYPGLYPIP